MNNSISLTNEQFKVWMEFQKANNNNNNNNNNMNQSNNDMNQSNNNMNQSNSNNNNKQLKKKVGDKVFTAEEINEYQMKRSERAMNRIFNGQVHRWMETDMANNRQVFFVMSAHQSKKGMTVRFGRTVFHPNAGQKHFNHMLNPAVEADQELIEAHFTTAENRLKKGMKNPQLLSHFTLPSPVWNPNAPKNAPQSRDKDELRQNNAILMERPLNLSDLPWARGAAEPDMSIWKEELIARMRSYMTAHPLPTRPGSTSSASSLNASHN